jgi:hypothetical protein
MRSGRREDTGGKKGEVISKMPQVEFDMEAIREIKKQKKGVCERYSKQSKLKRR